MIARARSRRLACALGLALAATLATPAVSDAKPAKTSKKATKSSKAANRARTEALPADSKPPIITHVRVTRSPVGKPIPIRARLDDQSEIFAPSVYVRVSGVAEFENLPMKRVDDGWEAVIAAFDAPVTLEYFLEAFDEHGNGPAREGTPESPIRLVLVDPTKAVAAPLADAAPEGEAEPDAERPVPKDEAPEPEALVAAPVGPVEEDDSLAGQWWFWTIVGAAVTGAVVAGALALQAQGGTVSAVDVNVLGPDPTRGLP
ncbi:hypothetical protein L6R52_13160 [Myxococcota bacterium]|nr:hypothetical protein [Myxococcota bacterium]